MYDARARNVVFISINIFKTLLSVTIALVEKNKNRHQHKSNVDFEISCRSDMKFVPGDTPEVNVGNMVQEDYVSIMGTVLRYGK